MTNIGVKGFLRLRSGDEVNLAHPGENRARTGTLSVLGEVSFLRAQCVGHPA